ncbi:MAG: substrate-binding domain-containing protein [Chloroflexi bacterium]|nr:substrate-binding domain-containing protein [Chloroflexota bacterium]
MHNDPFIDRQLGDFIIRERIGQGGMATVYRAYQPSVNRDVALKIIPLKEEDHQNELFRRRFNKEAELVASLEHIHILPVYDYGITPEAAFLAMRLLRGGTLSDLLRHGPLKFDQAAHLFRQFASGLAHAHQHNVVHRDLKPSNIMLDDAGNAMLTDFGLAKLIGDSLEITQAGTIIGTPAYMAPEQLRAQPFDHRADIYSAGVVLYHMLTGRAPFGGPTSDLVTTIYQHLEEPPPSPRGFNPAILPDAEVVILRALHKAPEDRFQSMRDMADALDHALGRPGSGEHSIEVVDKTHPPLIHSTSSPDSNPSTPRTISVTITLKSLRRSILIGVGLMVLLVMILGLVIVMSGPDDDKNDDTLPAPTVILGEQGKAEEAIPTEAEIERAQRKLGADGFIAYIACTLSTEYHVTQAREMGDFAAAYELAYRIYDSNADAYSQLTQIEKARADGAKALIICPLDPTLLDRPMQSVQQAGIPLVFMHSDIPSYGGVLLAGDDYEMGLKAGRFGGQVIAQERDGQANVILLGYPDLPILVTRADGLEAGLKEFAPEANVIGRYLGGTREFGEKSVRDLLEDGVKFDAILSINDAGALGAIAALEDAGIEPDQVIISSVDAEEPAKEYIREGYYMRGSVEINRELFSRTGVNAMVKLLGGGLLPEIFLISPGEVVTAETLAAE